MSNGNNKKTAVTILTRDEQNALTKYESIIDRGLKALVDVGRALNAIREAKLYRIAAPTFEAYVEGRFNIKVKRAYEFIDHYKIMDTKELKGENLNEAQAAALKSVPEGKRKEVLETAKKTAKRRGKRMTAKDIFNAKNGGAKVYDINAFAKDLAGLVNKAKAEGIPLLVITDTIGAVHGELVRLYKNEQKANTKPAA